MSWLTLLWRRSSRMLFLQLKHCRFTVQLVFSDSEGKHEVSQNGSAWSLVNPSASISSVGHHLMVIPVLDMHCFMMAKSMATRLSSDLQTEDMELRWSYNDLQSVTPAVLMEGSLSLGTPWREGFEIKACCGIWFELLRSKAPVLASVSIRATHSAIAQAVEKLWRLCTQCWRDHAR